jgi:hypothetical protein
MGESENSNSELKIELSDENYQKVIEFCELSMKNRPLDYTMFSLKMLGSQNFLKDLVKEEMNKK